MKILKKIVVVTEHFPPSNTAGSNRVYSWAKHLSKFGYYPVFLTPNTINQDTVHVITNETYEVHYIKCNDNSIREFRIKHSGNIIGKLFGAIDIATENFLSYRRYSPIITEGVKFISTNNVHGIIATAPSYSIFRIAKTISKQTSKKWIADYRDDWTTSEIFSGIKNFIIKLETPLEIITLKSSSAFTSISPEYIRKIKKLINKEGYLVENGFEEESNSIKISSSNTNSSLSPINRNYFNILYPGTLYPKQSLKFLVDILDFIPEDSIKHVKVNFIGTSYNPKSNDTQAIKKYIDAKIVNFTPRIDKIAADLAIKEAEALLYIAHRNKNGTPLKGVPSSKLYEYIKFEKPVILSPTDNDFAQQKLIEAKIALEGDNPESIAKNLLLLISDWKSNIRNQWTVPAEVKIINTRKHSASLLALVLDNVFK